MLDLLVLLDQWAQQDLQVLLALLVQLEQLVQQVQLGLQEQTV
jgi:hypothetical protein